MKIASVDRFGNPTGIKPIDFKNYFGAEKVSPSTPIIPSGAITKSNPMLESKPQLKADNNLSDVDNPLIPGTKLSKDALKEINLLKSTPSPIIESTTEPEEDDSNQRFLARLLGQGVAMFGAGIAGRDPMKVAEQFNEQQFYSDRLAQSKENEKYNREQREAAIEQAKSLMDPKSKQSERKRLIYEKSLGIKIPPEFSASDLEDRNVLQGLIAQSQPKPVLGKGGGVAQPKEEKEKKNPFQKEINFVNIYAKNGIQALDELKKLIQEKGTFELFGSAGTKMNQYIRDIAMAKTKILDPNSVISQGEIDSVKKTLGLDDYTKAFTSNKSAIEGIDNFKNILINNKNNAINILESLPSEESFNDKEKFIIEQYKNNPDDPDTRRAYNNMLKSKGR